MSRYLYIAALVIAGEMIFGLPFHTSRFFRPTLLEVFGFTNTQLGDLFAVYGVTAMVSYFPGGAIADRFSARFLLTASLVATGCGGLYMATIPGAKQMAVLYGFWGITTIFLFWGALIRATREWGGESSQGAAFGILEAGRGIAAAVFAVFLVAVLAAHLPDDATLATDAERVAGMRAIILAYSAVAFLVGAFAWFVIPYSGEVASTRRNLLANMVLVVRRPVIWAQAAIIVCAYCGYKGADYYSLYAVEVLGMDEVQGARLASYGAYVRPVAALTAGFIADRFDATRSIGVAFILLAFVYTLLSVLLPGEAGLKLIYANLFVSLFAVFAIRGIYFALLQETRTPRHVTGAAVGMVSLLGYTPEIFFAPIAGRILDATPGAGGHHNLFLFLAAIAACGVLVVAWLLWLERNKSGRTAVS
ncbi:MAG: MFS transporter [Gammaproteobacteria bacterium]|nr:MFS transporter [Gammaproteobacteria bacterium]MDH3410240.1 MFS transporter [Gammaproteobacteria bacterium]